MSGRKRSYIWTCFAEKSPGKAECNFCHNLISYVAGTTSNMSRHLKLRHPGIQISRQNCPQPTPASVTSDDPVCTNTFSTPLQSDHCSSPATTSDFPLLTTITPSISSAYPKTNPSSKTSNQSSLTSYVIKPVSQSRSKELDTQLIRMIVKEYQPISIVEDDEFKKFVFMLNPGYSLPCRKTITTNLIPQLYDKIANDLRQLLTAADSCAITTDSWTSDANQNYLAVTVHFIDDNCELKTFLLSCMEFSENHTADNIATELKNKVGEWGIAEKVSAVVSDNAANLKAAVRLCQMRHIPCLAHTINLIVQAGITEMKNILSKAKLIVKFFKKSPQAASKLKNMQRQMGCKELKLKQEVPTRWNSTLIMFQRLLQSKDPLVSTIALLNPDLDSITAHEWIVLAEICGLLKIFEEITVEISSQKSITISKVCLLARAMANHVNKIKSDTKLAEVSAVCNVMLEQLKHIFCDVENDSLLTESVLLDPRFKNQGFKDEASFQNAFRKISMKVRNVKIPKENSSATGKLEVANITTSSAWQDFDTKVQPILKNSNDTVAGILELDKYLSEKLIPRTQNPLAWWKERRMTYPRLFKLMKMRLCIPASSAPCERIFSKTGQLITERRTRLSSKNVEKIIFLHVNM